MELKNLLEGHHLASETAQKLLHFHQIVLQENEIQNLTRLTSAEEFFFGHLTDGFELHKANLVDYPAADLGSGVGVPGIPMAILGTGPWVLVESEKKKAEYLSRAVSSLSLSTHVDVAPVRIEEFLRKDTVKSIVARAVGPVDRIYGWIRGCSTWNNLVLLKGPGWEEEWAKFQQTKFKKELKIHSEYSYQVGPEAKQRKIVKLIRVPRGTSSSKRE